MVLKLPLLLGGDVSAAVRSRLSQEECPQLWMTRNQDEVAGMQRAFVRAGADVLCAPTGGANTLELSAWELSDRAGDINAALVAMSAGVSGGRVPVAGVISSAGHLPEPFGPLPYTDLIDSYAEQALALAASGAKLLLLRGMRTLGDARAAALGARQAALPTLLSVGACGGDDDADPLALLLCLQELGIAAFGLSFRGAADAPRILERLAPYAKVPLLAEVDVADRTPEELSKDCFELLAAGARLLLAGADAAPEHAAALRLLLDDFDFASFPLPEPTDNTPLLLTDEKQVYYLEEDFTTSDALDCEIDMSEAILQAEDQGADALLFHVRTFDDAYQLGQNAHMAGTAVSLLADSEEALEMALLQYRGRALVDARSDVEPGLMRALAKGYGAIVR